MQSQEGEAKIPICNSLDSAGSKPLKENDTKRNKTMNAYQEGNPTQDEFQVLGRTKVTSPHPWLPPKTVSQVTLPSKEVTATRMSLTS